MIAAIPLIAVLKDIIESVILHREQRRSPAQETFQPENDQEKEALPL
jgi:hypothetical protein